MAHGEGGTSSRMTRPAFSLIPKNTYNLAESEDVLKYSGMLLKFCGKSRPRRSYKNGFHNLISVRSWRFFGEEIVREGACGVRCDRL